MDRTNSREKWHDKLTVYLVVTALTVINLCNVSQNENEMCFTFRNCCAIVGGGVWS